MRYPYRYNFAKKGGRLAIDFANNGLRCGNPKMLNDSALDGTVTVIGEIRFPEGM